MKKIIIIGSLFLTGCYEYIPPGVTAQFTSENYLDSLYKPAKVENKIGINEVTVKDYLDTSKQRKFQEDTNHYYHLSKDEWAKFTNKLNDIISKGNGRVKGFISIENYQVDTTEHTTAVFVDSTLRKVFATIQMK